MSEEKTVNPNLKLIVNFIDNISSRFEVAISVWVTIAISLSFLFGGGVLVNYMSNKQDLEELKLIKQLPDQCPYLISHANNSHEVLEKLHDYCNNREVK